MAEINVTSHTELTNEISGGSNCSPQVGSHEYRSAPSELLESIFRWNSACIRQRAAPLLREREEYLVHMLKQGTSKQRVRSIAGMLLNIVRLMELDQLRPIRIDELKLATQRWLVDTVAHKRAGVGPTSAYIFNNLAMNWFRFHKILLLDPVAPLPYGDILERFVVFIRDTRGLTPTTVSSYKSRVSLFLRWSIKRHDVFSTISLMTVDDYVRFNQGEGWTPRTTASQCQALRTFFRFTREHGLHNANIASGIFSPTVPRYDPGMRGPSWKDVRRLLGDSSSLRHADLRATAILFLCSIYALRSSEVANLLLSDFDWVSSTFAVRRVKHGRVQHYPIQFEVGEAILNYLRKARPTCEDRHLFVTLCPEYRQVPSSTIWEIVAERMRRLNIASKQRGPHSLRHSCATQLLRRGSSLKDIADFLGHRDISSVSIYAKFDHRSLAKVSSFSLAGVT